MIKVPTMIIAIAIITFGIYKTIRLMISVNCGMPTMLAAVCTKIKKMKSLTSVAMMLEVVIFVSERRIKSPMPECSTARLNPTAFKPRSIKSEMNRPTIKTSEVPIKAGKKPDKVHQRTCQRIIKGFAYVAEANYNGLCLHNYFFPYNLCRIICAE